MKCVTSVACTIALTAVLLSGAAEPPGPSLDRPAREAIIAAGIQAIGQDVKIIGENEIPKEAWGEVIVRLKPLRVRNDRMNAFIVLKEDQTTEEGLYVSHPLSSYAPGTDKRFVRFEKWPQSSEPTFGELYYCRIVKAKPDSTANGILPVPSATNRTSSVDGPGR